VFGVFGLAPAILLIRAKRNAKMTPRFVTALGFVITLGLSGCSAVGVATTVVGIGVGVASTGVHIGVGTTVRAVDLIVPDGAECEPADEPVDEYPEEIEDRDCVQD